MKAVHRNFDRNQLGSADLALIVPILAASLCLFSLLSINLASIFFSYASLSLCARECCAAAAKANCLDDALTEMTARSSSLMQGPVGQFGRLRPNGGYGGSGVDLYLSSTDIVSSKTSTIGPNLKFPTVDTSANVYECRADMHFVLTPVLGLASAPIVGEIPGIGKPVMIRCSAHRAIEQPTGFLAESTVAAQAVAPSANQNRPAIPGEISAWSMSDGIFKLQPGQIVAQRASCTLHPDDPSWISLKDAHGQALLLKNGQRVSVISDSSSLWDLSPSDAPAPGETSVSAIELKVGINGAALRNYSSSFNLEVSEQGVLYFRSNRKDSLVHKVTVLVTN